MKYFVTPDLCCCESKEPIYIKAVKTKTYLSIQLSGLNQEINIRLLEGCGDRGVSLTDRCQEVGDTGRHTPLGPTDRTNGARLRLKAVLTSLPRHWLRQACYRLGQVCHWLRWCCQSPGLPRDSPLPFRRRLDGLCETCHSKTVFSLGIHQIFTMLSYSRSAAWRKGIMWTSCGWHGNIGCCNNRLHRKIETNQMYEQEINNWKPLILVLSAPQNSARKKHAGFQKVLTLNTNTEDEDVTE